MDTQKPEEQVADSASVPALQKPSVPASLGQAVGDSVQSVLQDAEEDPKDGFFITGDELRELEHCGSGWLKDRGGFGWVKDRGPCFGMPQDGLVVLVGVGSDKRAIARVTMNSCSEETLMNDVHVDIVRWIS